MDKNKNIVLIGFMGCGKSTAAKILGACLSREIVSTDAVIEERVQMSVSEIFRVKGETYFRALEKAVVAEIALRTDLIIDSGGGIVLDPENLQRLKEHGILFYLKASPEVLYRRLKDQTTRPLLQVADPFQRIQDLFHERTPLYGQADFTVDASDDTMKPAVREILKVLHL